MTTASMTTAMAISFNEAAARKPRKMPGAFTSISAVFQGFNEAAARKPRKMAFCTSGVHGCHGPLQ